MKEHSPTETIIDALTLPECPRWHEGALYFSDIMAGRLCRLADDGEVETLFEAKDVRVGGIGFLEDGDIVAVLQNRRTVVRIHAGETSPYADLSGLVRFGLNDMIVGDGLAYISQPGFDLFGDGFEGQGGLTDMLLIGADGSPSIVASDLHGPNGMAITQDGKWLFVAESGGGKISEFSIGPEGALLKCRTFAMLPGNAFPDGICLDDSGGVWAAAPLAREEGWGSFVVRLVEDGSATDIVRMKPGRHALACAFGGEGRNTLFVCTTESISGDDAFAPGKGRIEAIRLDYSGSGKP